MASAKPSTSSSVVYTLGVIRNPWNSSCLIGVTKMRRVAQS